MKTGTKVVLGFFAGVGMATAVTVTAANKAFGEHGFHGERMINRVEQKLDLDQTQSEQLQQLISKVQTMRETWREQRDENMAMVRDLIAEPTLDQQQLLALVESKTDEFKAQAPEVIAAVAAFSDSLSAEQKQEVLDMMERRMEHRKGDRKGHRMGHHSDRH